MVKHTQTIRQLLPKNCLGAFDHFVGLALKGLKVWQIWLYLGLRQLRTLFGVELNNLRKYFPNLWLVWGESFKFFSVAFLSISQCHALTETYTTRLRQILQIFIISVCFYHICIISAYFLFYFLLFLLFSCSYTFRRRKL